MNKSIFLIALLLCLTWSACDDDQATFPDEAEFMDFAIGKYLVPANDGLWLIPGDNGELLETDTIYIGGHGSLMTSSFWFVDEHTLLIGAVIWEGAPMGNDPYMLWQSYLDQRGESIHLFVRCNYHYDPATGILTTDSQQLTGEARGTVHRLGKLSDGRWTISVLFREPLFEIIGRRYLLEPTLTPDNSAAYDYLIFESHEEAKNYVVATLEAAGIVVDDYYL